MFAESGIAGNEEAPTAAEHRMIEPSKETPHAGHEPARHPEHQRFRRRSADLNKQHRYNAACSAALAAAGQGEDARLLPDKVVVMFRRWALGWLRDDLRALAQLAEQNNPAVKQAIQQRMAHWWNDPDLACVRDRSALDRLSDQERAAWRSLWRDVDELPKRVANKSGERNHKLEEMNNPKKKSEK